MKAIYWFRNDLRLEDNQGLMKCLAGNEEVIPVYVFDSRHFKETDLGLSKTGFFRTKFLLESLADLQSNLRNLGSNLVIRMGSPEEELPRLAIDSNATAVYCTKEVTFEEVAVEQKLERTLSELNKRLVTTWQATLYHEEDIPWPINRLPEVFTSFRKEAEKESSVRPAIQAPHTMPKVDLEIGKFPLLEDLGLQTQSISDHSAYPFLGGETKANERLQHYLFGTDLIADYKNTRNELIGTEYSSKLSAWLSLGCISPRVVYEQVKHYEKTRKKNQSTYWLIFELMWRDYFRFVAKKHGKKIFLLSGLKGEEPQLTNNHEWFNRWANGETGVPFIDANMTELNKTGFMSNRGRQNVASYLINDLNINWTWGASYFESLLVDYDPCTNWGNWAYIAGVGNDPRKDRYFNVEAQAERHDPKGDYVNLWIRETPLKTT